MSDPLYPFSRGALPGGNGKPPPPRYSDFEVDLIAARYASSPPPPPYPSAADASAFDSHVGAFDSHVDAFDSLVGAFDSPVGAFDSHFGAFDSHAGAGRSAGGESGHLPVSVGVRHFPCVFIGNAAVFWLMHGPAWAICFLFLFVVTVVYGRMAAC